MGWDINCPSEVSCTLACCAAARSSHAHWDHCEFSTFPITLGRALKRLRAQGKRCQNRDSHRWKAQRKGIGGNNPCKHAKSGKRKSDDSLRIKDNSFLHCWELSVSLEVISEEKTSCEPNIFLHTWYQQILTLDSISLPRKAPSACGGEEGDDRSTFCSKIPANTQAGFPDREGSSPVT